MMEYKVSADIPLGAPEQYTEYAWRRLMSEMVHKIADVLIMNSDGYAVIKINKGETDQLITHYGYDSSKKIFITCEISEVRRRDVVIDMPRVIEYDVPRVIECDPPVSEVLKYLSVRILANIKRILRAK